MADVSTYSNIVSLFKDIADRHYQINTFGVGSPWEIGAKEVMYPLLWVQPVTADMVKSEANDRYVTIEIVMNVKCLDLVHKDESNEVDVESDTFQILTDVINEFNDHPFYQRSNMRLIDDISFTSLDEYSDDQTDGWECEIRIRMRNINSFCGIPAAQISGYSFTGPEFSATSYSTQYLTCETVTGCTTLQTYIINEIAQQGQVVWSGGVVVNDAVFQQDVTIQGDTFFQNATGDTLYLTALSADTIYSGNTDLYDIFITQNDGNDITRVQPGTNTTTGGTPNNPTVNVVDSPSFNDIYFSGTAYGGAVSASTFYSAGTALETIITNISSNVGDKTRVQPGVNITTGGTANFPVINLDDNINVLTISAGTIYSGSTDVSELFLDWTLQADFNSHTGDTNNPHNVTAAQVGAYSTSQTDALLDTKADLSGATFTNFSADTIYSGSTNLYDIFITEGDITRVQPGTNISTGGTANFPIVNLNDDINLSSVSATTFYSGSTNLETIINSVATGGLTKVQDGINTFTGGTTQEPTVNVTGGTFGDSTFTGDTVAYSLTVCSSGTSTSNLSDCSLNTISSGSTESAIIGGSGNTINSGAQGVVVIGSKDITGTVDYTTYLTNLRASGVIYSANTDLYNIFVSQTSEDITRIQPGSNINTGGTANFPIINLDDNIDVISISADTIYSGSTDVSTLISQRTLQTDFNSHTGDTSNPHSVTAAQVGAYTTTQTDALLNTKVDITGTTISDINARLGEGLSTGIISGGTLSINAGDNTKFDIEAGAGYIVDYTVYPQITTLLTWPTTTGITLTNLATSFATDVAINSSGTILQQNSYTKTELRSIIFLGGLDHSTQTEIRNIFPIQVPTYGVGSSLKDLTLAIGDINISGNIYGANGVNLNIDKTSGETFSYGRGYDSDQLDPSTVTSAAGTGITFNYIFDNVFNISYFLFIFAPLLI